MHDHENMNMTMLMIIVLTYSSLSKNGSEFEMAGNVSPLFKRCDTRRIYEAPRCDLSKFLDWQTCDKN